MRADNNTLKVTPFWLTSLLSFVLMFWAVLGVAATDVAGSINSDTTWTLANQPYQITSDIIIENNAVLTIEAGVTIYLQAGSNLIVRAGGLNAQGSGGSPIVMTSMHDVPSPDPAPLAGDWGALIFENGTQDAQSLLNHVAIRYGQGIVVQSASPHLDNLTIQHNTGPAISIDLNASPIGQGLTASNNRLNGIYVPAGDVLDSVVWGLVGIPYVVEVGNVSVGASPVRLTPTASTISPDVVVEYTISLSIPAPVGGQDFNIVSSIPAVASAPALITVLEGETTASFSVTALALGFTSLTVSATGVGEAAAGIEVIAEPTLILAPSAATLGLDITQQMLLSLSHPAPNGGLVVSLQSDNESSVTLPSDVTVMAGDSSITFDLLTLVAGDAIITAQAPDYADATADISVKAAALVLPASAVVSPGSTISIPINLTKPAPVGGLAINLAIDNAGVATVPASIVVAEGDSVVNVDITGLIPGMAIITVTAIDYDSATTALTVDTIAIDFDPVISGTLTIPQEMTRQLRVKLSKPAPPGGLTIDLSSSDDASLTVTPSQVTIPASQTQANIFIGITGVAVGSATITASNTGLIAKQIDVNISEKATLEVYLHNKPKVIMGHGLRSENVYYVRRRVAGSNFYWPEETTINLVSSDPSKVSVPITITIPANNYRVNFSIDGIAPTTGLVSLTATAAKHNESVPVEVQVIPPTLDFISLDNTRSLSSGRDDFYAQWVVPEAVDYYYQRAITEQTISLTTSNATPANIIPGFYNANSNGTEVSGLVIPAGRTRSNYAAHSFVGQPVAIGSYQVLATLSGVGSWESNIQTVSQPQLAFSASGPNPTLVGKSLRSDCVMVLTHTNGINEIAVGSDIEITLSSSQSSVLTVPTTVILTAGSSQVCIPLSGQALTATDAIITATAAGFSAVDSQPIQVVSPILKFVSLDANRSTQSIRDNFYVAWEVTGAVDYHYQRAITDQTIALSFINDNPLGLVPRFYDQATGGTLQTATIIPEGRTGSNYSGYSYVATPTIGGVYQIQASLAGIGSGISEVQTVSAPDLVLTHSGAGIIGKGLTSYCFQLRVQQQINGANFSSANPVVINVMSSDPTKVQVPATVTIPANSSSSCIPMDGIDTTTSPVEISISRAGYNPPAAQSVEVILPELKIQGLANTRSLAHERDGFYLSWYVPGSSYANNAIATQDQTIQLSITDANPPGLIPGIYDAKNDGTAITSVEMLAGQNNTTNNYAYIGTPTQNGSYTVTADVAGITSVVSNTQTVAQPELQFYLYGYPKLILGKGMVSKSWLRVQRVVDGATFKGAQADTVNLSCQSTAICSVPSTVTIPAGVAYINVPVTGMGIGATVITGSATGYQSAVAANVETVQADLTFSNTIASSISVGGTDPFRVYIDVPGSTYGGQQLIAPISVNLTSAVPGVATVPATVPIILDRYYSDPVSLQAISAGTTSITASAAGFTPITSPTVTVTP